MAVTHILSDAGDSYENTKKHYCKDCNITARSAAVIHVKYKWHVFFLRRGVYCCVHTVNPRDAADFTECYNDHVQSARIPVSYTHLTLPTIYSV